MILDLDAPGSASPAPADVCIVGAGAVGLLLAHRLVQQGADVLLLEGGGPRLEADSQLLQQGESVGHPFANIGVGRYRVLGGTTTYWGGQLYPMDAFITGARPWLGHAEWPVASQELAHWHEQAYAALGLSDVVTDDAAIWPAIGQPVPDFGSELELLTTRWVKTRNFARLFGPTLRRPAGLRVLTHANVTALRLDSRGRRIAGCVVQSLRGRSEWVQARRVVLANGSLEIARLMLHPLADGGPAPWARSAWLGRPLIDHLDCKTADVHVLDHDRFHAVFDSIFHGGHKYYPKLRLARDVQRREGLVDIASEFGYRTRFSEHLNYLKMFMRSVRDGSEGVSLAGLPKHAGALAATAWPLAKRYLADRRSFKPRDAEVSLLVHTEQLPNPRSRLSLGEARDALGMQRLRVDWQIDGRELLTMRRYTAAVADALLAQGLARVEMRSALASGDPAFASGIIDAVHQMGTARMAGAASEGVVDANLQVFGCSDLYVAGAAVFPSTGFANPTFTALALALRLAEHLSRATP